MKSFIMLCFPMRFFHKQIALRSQKEEKFFSPPPPHATVSFVFCSFAEMKAIWKWFRVVNYLDST